MWQLVVCATDMYLALLCFMSSTVFFVWGQCVLSLSGSLRKVDLGASYGGLLSTCGYPQLYVCPLEPAWRSFLVWVMLQSTITKRAAASILLTRWQTNPEFRKPLKIRSRGRQRRHLRSCLGKKNSWCSTYRMGVGYFFCAAVMSKNA